MNARFRLPFVLCAVAVVALACAKEEPPPTAFTGDASRGNPTVEEVVEEVSGEAPEATPLTADQEAQLQAALDETPPGCDILDTRACLLPFPSDAYTVDDDSTGTQRRVDFPTGLLANAEGSSFDPTQWNRNDGFSPSTPILIHVPNLDPDKTDLPPEDDIGMSTTRQSATVLVDLDTGLLVPHWAEMDLRAETDEDRALIIRPATSLKETHRFAVALRNLVGTDGETIEAPIGFKVLRDNNPTTDERVESRRAEFEPIFADMAAAGVNRKDLYISWYFTVASAESLAGQVLEMRDDAFGQLSGAAPQFAVTDVSTDELQPGIAKIVTGTFEVPLYLDDSGEPGSSLVISDETGLPTSVGTYTADFTCSVPEAGIESGESTPVVYGHGLLGSSEQAASSAIQTTAAKNNAVYCATNWIGISEEDVGYAVQALSDISKFPSMPDRMQQGMINTLYLGRLMIHLGGLGSAAEFQTDGGANMLNTASAYYDGNSQGGIMGGAVTAIAQDWTKAVLGVTGMNYSTLLNRSVDFDEYAVVLRNAYPNALDQQLIFGILQMLWDRGETSGYVQHLTDRTYRLTPAKEVVLTVAFGDHQVAPITAQNIARTLKIPVYQPALPDGATTAEEPFYGLDAIDKFPYEGSALFYWYAGTLEPPLGNITPTMSEQYIAECTGDNADDEDTAPCADPHGLPRRQPGDLELKKSFFRPDGNIPDVCHEEPCLAKSRDELDD